MKILFISPLGFPIRPDSRYVGIEKLVWYYTRELVKQHEVAVWGHADSIFPDGVTVYPYKPDAQVDVFAIPELKQYQVYQSTLRKYDIIHDFSHQHLASRFNPNLPSLNLFWHAPSVAQYPKAPYNIVALSHWAAREFRRVYRQDARYQASICIDTALYKPSQRHRNDRFMALARMGADKGNLEAALLCKKLGVPLDIVSARGTEAQNAPLTDYEKEVLKLCDGQQIKLFPDSLPESDKIKMMQTNKALIYVSSVPEPTSHKIQECLLTGMPAVVPGIGALPEIVTQGVDGYLCRTEDEYLKAMLNVDKLDAMKTYEATKKKYGIEEVVADNIRLYDFVASGLRW